MLLCALHALLTHWSAFLTALEVSLPLWRFFFLPDPSPWSCSAVSQGLIYPPRVPALLEAQNSFGFEGFVGTNREFPPSLCPSCRVLPRTFGSTDIPCSPSLGVLVSMLAQSVLWGVQASLQTHLFPEEFTFLGFLALFCSSLCAPGRWEQAGAQLSLGIAPRGLPNIP